MCISTSVSIYYTGSITLNMVINSTMEPMYPSTFNSLIILFISFVVALSATITTCTVQQDCIQKKTCFEPGGVYYSSGSAPWCGYTTIVSMSTDAAYSSSSASSSNLIPTDGLCSPGERLSVAASGGIMRCAPHYTYPNALNREIMMTDTNTAQPPHMQACGRWIEASTLEIGSDPVYRSFETAVEWATFIKNLENETTHSHVNARGALSKFRAQCVHTHLQGMAAVRQATVDAYEYLKAPIVGSTNRSTLLRACGWIVSNGCSGPVQIEANIVSLSRPHFSLSFLDGYVYSPNVFSETLHLMEESVLQQQLSEDAMHNIRVRALQYQSPAVSMQDIVHVLSGHTGRMESSSHVNPAYTTNLLDAIVDGVEEDEHNLHNATLHTLRMSEARAYLLGVASFCAQTMTDQSMIHPPSQPSSLSNFQRERSLIRSKYGSSDRSGMFHLTVEGGDTSTSSEREGTNRTIFTASLSQLVVAHSDGTVEGNCLDMARVLFPDQVTSIHFDNTVHSDLYASLGAITEDVRHQVQRTVQLPIFSDVYSDVLSIASEINSTGVRFAGSPHGTWGSWKRPVREPPIDGDRSFVTNGFIQTRTQFNSIVKDLVLEDGDKCDVPIGSIEYSISANAHFDTVLHCAVILLGISRRPWLDVQYDEESIYSRSMMVLAHEFGHSVKFKTRSEAAFASLMHRYPPEHREEGIADLIGVISIYLTGKVSMETLLMHFCQLWCARTPPGWQGWSNSVHPQPNDRCDLMYNTIQDIAAQIPPA